MCRKGRREREEWGEEEGERGRSGERRKEREEVGGRENDGRRARSEDR